MRAAVLALAMVWAGAFPASGAGEDLLGHAERAAGILARRASRDILAGGGGGGVAARLAAALELPPGTAAHLLGPGGRVWASTVAKRGGGPSTRDGLWETVCSAPAGVTSDLALNDAHTELVRRDVGWQTVDVAGRAFRLVIERQWTVERDPDNPWSGKWTGACSRRQWVRTGDAVTETREATPLSAIVYQTGTACWIRLAASDWSFEASGFLHGDGLRAGADAPVSILDLVYSADEDKLRGTIEYAGPDQAGSVSVFLQRVRGE